MRFRTVAVLALTLGLVGGASTAALAGQTPTPTPTVTPNFGYHPPKVVLRDWQFDLRLSDGDGLSLNDVQGFGALAFNRWSDTQLSPNLDKFSLGGNSITLWHDSLAAAALTVNRQTCTITFDQPYGRFRVVAGTGIGAGLRSRNGQFDLQGMISVENITKYRKDIGVTVCPLRFRSNGQILRAVLYNRPLGGVVTMDQFSVQGDAKLFRLPVKQPHPYPTQTYTVTPSATA